MFIMPKKNPWGLQIVIKFWKTINVDVKTWAICVEQGLTHNNLNAWNNHLVCNMETLSAAQTI